MYAAEAKKLSMKTEEKLTNNIFELIKNSAAQGYYSCILKSDNPIVKYKSSELGQKLIDRLKNMGYDVGYKPNTDIIVIRWDI